MRGSLGKVLLPCRREPRSGVLRVVSCQFAPHDVVLDMIDCKSYFIERLLARSWGNQFRHSAGAADFQPITHPSSAVTKHAFEGPDGGTGS